MRLGCPPADSAEMVTGAATQSASDALHVGQRAELSRTEQMYVSSRACQPQHTGPRAAP
jgi:hypothetical protein